MDRDVLAKQIADELRPRLGEWFTGGFLVIGMVKNPDSDGSGVEQPTRILVGDCEDETCKLHFQSILPPMAAWTRGAI